jgi:Uma2 family endonuclease
MSREALALSKESLRVIRNVKVHVKDESGVRGPRDLRRWRVTQRPTVLVVRCERGAEVPVMSVQALSYSEMIGQLPPESLLVLRGVSWKDYEALLDAVGEAKGLRVTYDRGRLEVMVLSAEHEHYAELIKLLVSALSLRLRIQVLHFGSITMKRSPSQGAEPDACFYAQNAPSIGAKKQIDFNVDPPPDIVVVVDLHHGSFAKFPVYASLGVPEIWRYDGITLAIYHLLAGDYISREASLAFPVLSAERLTDWINRSRTQNQYEVLVAFEAWLQAVGPSRPDTPS